jgi:hypothetical protein
MARLRVAVTLSAPPKEVWADIERIPTHTQWMEDAVAIRITSPQAAGTGTTFECDTRVGPFRLTDVMEVTRWDPPTAMGVRHVGLVTGEGEFRLRAARRGRTRFRWDERLHFPWWMGGPVGAWASIPVLKLVWRRSLRNLAARFEPAPQAGQEKNGGAAIA